jgi:hypothetical protein
VRLTVAKKNSHQAHKGHKGFLRNPQLNLIGESPPNKIQIGSRKLTLLIGSCMIALPKRFTDNLIKLGGVTDEP